MPRLEREPETARPRPVDPAFRFDRSKAALVERRATANIWENPNGTRTAEVYTSPVNYRAADGTWRPIESTLVPDGAGFRNKAGSFTAKFGKSSTDGATLRGTGWSIGFELPGATTVDAVATKNRVVYPGVYEETDVEFHVLGGGVEQQFVLQERPDQARWLLGLELKGVTASQGDDGVVVFTDREGDVVARVPQGVAFDSADTTANPRPAADTLASVRLIGGAGDQSLEITVDAGWLADPARVYPVRVDPWVPAGEGAYYDHDAYISSGCGGCNYNSSSHWNGYAYVNKVGRRPGQVTPEFYSLLYYDLGFANWQNIWSANWYGYFDVRDGADAFTMWRTAGGWNPSTVTWNSFPGHFDGSVAGAGTGWISRDLTSWVYDWTHGAMANNGITINTSGNFTYYEFRADEEETNGTGGQNRLEVTYDLPPNAPTNLSPNGSRVGSTTPGLSARYSDPNNESGTCWFEVWNSALNFRHARFAAPQVGSGATCSASVPSGALGYNTFYYWRVQAQAADGLGGQWGGFSGWASFTTPTVPGTPGAPAATVTGCDTSATVSWTAPADNGGMTITGYRIRALNPDGSYAGIQKTVGSTTFSTSMTGLARGATYKFGIAASNSAGYGGEAVTGTVTIVTTASAPRNATATANPDGTSATVSWLAPTSDGDSPITSYTIRAYNPTTGAYTGQQATVLAPQTSGQITGLAQGTSYRFGVTATNCAGTGVEGFTPNVTTIAKPGTPQNVNASGGVGTITASWSAPASDGGATVTGYAAELFNANGTTTGQTRTECGTCFTTTFGGLPAGTSYFVRVTATNSAGTGTFGQSNTAVTAAAPGAPTGVTAQNAAEPGTATVEWTPPASNGGTPITGYRVRVYLADSGQYANIEVSACATCTRTDVGGLLPSRRYEFRVTALNAAGESSPGVSNAITTPGAFTAVKSAVPFESGALGKGDAVVYTVTLTNRYPTAHAPVTFTDTLPAGVAAENVAVTVDGITTPCGSAFSANPTALECVLGVAAADGSRPLDLRGIPAFTATESISYAAVLVGGDRNCDQVVNTMQGTDSGGGTFAANVPVSFCDTGLGREPWFSFATRDLGPQGVAYLNPANGNVVVQQTDSEPMQARGRLAYVLRRTYNSQDTTIATLPGSFGAGWILNIGQTDDLAIDGVTPSGLHVPAVAAAVKNPLAVTMIDRDGTRHVFRPKGLGSPIPLTALNSAAAPQSLVTPAGTTICVDQTYTAPAGVHLGMWRYLQVTNTDGSCVAAAGTQPAVIGFAAIRPDRLRYEFDASGRLRQMTDGAGVSLRYLYEAQVAIPGLVPQLTAVFEPASCTLPGGGTPTSRDALPATCRAFRFTYPSETETRVTDPAGRLTRYLFTIADGEPKRLTSVVNPDNTTLAYTYGGTNCAGNLLCSAKDPRGATVSFAYNTPPAGLSRVSSVTDRNGSATTVDYGTDSARFTEGSHVQQFASIDNAGRVGRTDEGTATVALRTVHYTWDRQGGTTCRQPDNKPDNNLCGRVREAKTGDPADDEITTTTYNAEGFPLSQSVNVDATRQLTTTHGYAIQQPLTTGTTATFADTITSPRVVTPGARAADASVLFTIADRTNILSPNGNDAGATWTEFLTTLTVDNASTAAPNQLSSPTAVLCDGTPRNTGVVCAETSRAVNAGGARPTTRHTYDRFGGRLTTTNAKALDETTENAWTTTDQRCPIYDGRRLKCTSYTYYADTDLDLTQRLSAGGWLKAVTDPDNKFVIFAYDEAGHPSRSWDRNATAGRSIADPWVTTPPSQNYAEKSYTATLRRADNSTYAGAWRYETSSRDAIRDSARPTGSLTSYTLDENGNRRTTRPPRGNQAGNATFDVTQTYDNEDNPTGRTMPSGAAGGNRWTWTYDDFDNRTTEQDPNGHRRQWTYDAANRATGARWSRSATSTEAPATCPKDTTSGQFLSGLQVCATATEYDGVDNVVAATDADGSRSTAEFDGAHRATTTRVPREVDPAAPALRTDRVYDADGNVTSACPPREFTVDGSGTCTANAKFGTHATYTPAGAAATNTVFRDAGQPKTTTIRYDAAGNRTETTDANLKTTTQRFDLQNRQLDQTTPRTAGVTNTTTWAYDAVGNVTAITRPGQPAARITAYSYDANNRVVDTVAGASSPNAGAAGTASGTQNARTRVAYDADGNVVAQFEPRAFTASTSTPDARYMVRTDFDADGRPVAQWVPRFDNQAATELGLSPVQAEQCKTTPTPDAVPGVAGYPTGVGVCVTRMTYDRAGNRTQIVLATSSGLNADGTNRDNRYISFGYTDDNLVSTVSAPSPINGSHATPTSRYLYDGNGRQLSHTDALGGARTTSYYRDGLVRETVDQGYTSGGRTITHATGLTYDANGNRRDVTDPAGSVTRTTYTTDNLVRESIIGANGADGGSITRYDYDNVGNPTNVYSPSAVRTLNGTIDPTNTKGTPTRNEYFDDNLLKATWQPVVVHDDPLVQRFRRTNNTYDGGGRKTREEVALVNGANAVVDGTLGGQTFAYAPNDRVISETGRNNETITTTYDAAGNRLTFADSTNTAATITASYYLDGLVRTVEDGPVGVNDNHRLQQYTYDAAGALIGRGDRLVASGTKVVKTTYSNNDAGLPASMTTGFLGGSATYQWTYDGDGRPTLETGPASSRVERGYNPDDTLATQTTKIGGTTVADVAYQYDNNGRITEQDLTSARSAATGQALIGKFTYNYDAAGRLSTFGDIANGASRTRTLAWDANGNRLGFGANPQNCATNPNTANTACYGYNADDSLKIVVDPAATPTTNTSTYDAAGRLATDSCATYSYDGFDRTTREVLTANAGCARAAALTIDFRYDGLDRQRQRSESAIGVTTTTSDLRYDGVGSQQLSELGTARRSIEAVYVLDPTSNPKAVDIGSTATNELLFDDGAGNTTNVTNQAGLTTCTARFDPYGTPLGTTTLDTNRVCNSGGDTRNDAFYAGARRDTATGQYQMGSRLYDPTRGGFTTPDSFRGAGAAAALSVGTDPLTLNRYSYVNGDPVNLVDPDGHAGCSTLTFGWAKKKCKETKRTVSRGYNKLINTDIGGARVRDWAWAWSQAETYQDGGKGAVNFGAGLVDGTTSAVTLGHAGTKIGPVYKADHLQISYKIGVVAGHIETGLATGALGAAAKTATAARFAGAGRVINAIQGSRVASAAAGAATNATLATASKNASTTSVLAAGGLGAIGGLARGLSATRGSAPPSVALDSSTARALITEGPVSRRLEAQLAGCNLVMCQTAFGEFDDAVTRLAGPTEKAAADALASRLTIVPDNPSARAMGLSLSRRVGANDRVVFGTADAMGVPIYTSDVNFLRGAAAQGVWFDSVVHPPASPRGL